MIYDSIEQLIGNTPLLKINPKVHGLKHVEVYAKLEYYNPFGSVKDRIAKGMLEPILPDLKRDGKTVLEASSGNTAKALATLSSMHGLKFKTITNRIKTPEIRMTLQLLGAEIDELPGLSDCPDPMDPNDFTTVAANLAKTKPKLYHYTDQYFNQLNFDTHYKTTGKEIYDDLKKVNYYFGFLGTSGSSMGAGQYLKDHSQTDIYGVVAAAGHHVPGGRNINELWEVGFFKKEFFKEIISGTTQEAIEGMMVLNRSCGILCGPTTGLTYATLIKKLKELDAPSPDGSKKTAVFIACDRMEPYMSYIQKYRPEIFIKETVGRTTVEKMSAQQIAEAPEVTVDELESMEKHSPIIIDIRGFFAYSIGHIKNSINILDEHFSQLIEEGPVFPKDKKIIIMCSVGNISKKYAAFLKWQGYEAFSLQGGIHMWKSTNKPVENTVKAFC